MLFIYLYNIIYIYIYVMHIYIYIHIHMIYIMHIAMFPGYVPVFAFLSVLVLQVYSCKF